MSIRGQIVSEIVAQLCLQNSIQTLLNFFLGRLQKKIRRVCMEFSEYNWATISETIHFSTLLAPVYTVCWNVVLKERAILQAV